MQLLFVLFAVSDKKRDKKRRPYNTITLLRDKSANASPKEGNNRISLLSMRLFIQRTSFAARRTFVRLMTQKIKTGTVKPLGLSVPLFFDFLKKRNVKKLGFFTSPINYVLFLKVINSRIPWSRCDIHCAQDDRRYREKRLTTAAQFCPTAAGLSA